MTKIALFQLAVTASFFAYDVGFRGGVYVAATADGRIITGAGALGNTGTLNMSNASSVAGTVTNNGTLFVGRSGVLNLNSGAVWTQNGDMTVAGQGGFGAVRRFSACVGTRGLGGGRRRGCRSRGSRA